jgi:hypothetical protein
MLQEDKNRWATSIAKNWIKDYIEKRFENNQPYQAIRSYKYLVTNIKDANLTPSIDLRDELITSFNNHLDSFNRNVSPQEKERFLAEALKLNNISDSFYAMLENQSIHLGKQIRIKLSKLYWAGNKKDISASLN